MDKEMCRGDTMLISIDAPTEYPVTTLQDVRMSIKQGRNEMLIPLSEFQLVTIPETGNNVPCVRELVNDEYFYNVGTGAFGYIDLEGNVHDA